RALGRLSDDLLLPALFGYHSLADSGGQPVHDLCALALIAAPGLVRCRPAHLGVDTQRQVTAGTTESAFDADAHNALVAMSVDAPGFWDMVFGALHRTAAHMDGA